MLIGNQELTRDQARVIVSKYARRHHKTVLWYDLAGEPKNQPGPDGAAEPIDRVTISDIGRLVIIGAGLRPDDVPPLLEGADVRVFAAVRPRVRLQDWERRNDLDVAVTHLYDAFRSHGIGGAKRSKLLHIKRPWLVPIYDSYVSRIYWDRVTEVAADIGDRAAAWWEAPKRDLLEDASDFAWLKESLAEDDDEFVRLAGRLTELRLLDIIAWQLGSETHRS